MQIQYLNLYIHQLYTHSKGSNGTYSYTTRKLLIRRLYDAKMILITTVNVPIHIAYNCIYEQLVEVKYFIDVDTLLVFKYRSLPNLALTSYLFQ